MLNKETRRDINCTLNNLKIYKKNMRYYSDKRTDGRMTAQEFHDKYIEIKEGEKQSREDLDNKTFGIACRNKCRSVWKSVNRYRKLGGLNTLAIPSYYI